MSINWNKGSWRTSQLFMSSYSKLMNCLSPLEGDSVRRTVISQEESTCSTLWCQKEILKDSKNYSFIFFLSFSSTLSQTPKDSFMATLPDNEKHD